MASVDLSPKAPPSSHRLPTVSASQALHSLQNRGSQAISTGLPRLDAILKLRGAKSGATAAPGTSGGGEGGGLVRGQVTEIYGPPGVGKTELGVQASASALREGHQVVWIDAGGQLVPNRLREVLSTAQPLKNNPAPVAHASRPLTEELLHRFHHHTVPTLAHLLALILHPRPAWPCPGTVLVVIDSLSTLFDTAYARPVDNSTKKTEAGRWQAGRKYTVMGDIASALGKLAAVRNIAVLVTGQTTTRFHVGAGAGVALVPALRSTQWDSRVSTRIVLFQDWALVRGKDGDDDRRVDAVRFAGCVKVNGVVPGSENEASLVVAFDVTTSGLVQVETGTGDSRSIAPPPPRRSSPIRTLKRSFSKVADSEDEEVGSDDEYGWLEEDQVAAEGLIGGVGSRT